MTGTLQRGRRYIRTVFYERIADCESDNRFSIYGGVPKWLKGPDSKSGRSASPAQEFESLHLRHVGANVISFAPTFLQKVRARSFCCSTFSAKSHAPAVCSLVNALTKALVVANFSYGAACGGLVPLSQNIDFDRPLRKNNHTDRCGYFYG